MTAERKIRVLVAKPGLDGHDRGAKTVASALRDAGMEVIYTGLHQTPEMIAEVAVQEDVDVVGLSILSGAHMALFPRVREELEARGMGHVLLTGGGIIPADDMGALERQGFAQALRPGHDDRRDRGYIQEEMQTPLGAEEARERVERRRHRPARSSTSRKPPRCWASASRPSTRCCTREDLPARKIGREWKFSRQALIEWVGSGRSRDFYRETGRGRPSDARRAWRTNDAQPRRGARPAGSIEYWI